MLHARIHCSIRCWCPWPPGPNPQLGSRSGSVLNPEGALDRRWCHLQSVVGSSQSFERFPAVDSFQPHQFRVSDAEDYRVDSPICRAIQLFPLGRPGWSLSTSQWRYCRCRSARVGSLAPPGDRLLACSRFHLEANRFARCALLCVCATGRYFEAHSNVLSGTLPSELSAMVNMQYV